MDDLHSKTWELGKPVFINRVKWDKPELTKMNQVLSEDWFAGNSRWNTEFEQKLAQKFGVRKFQTTNSGSAALEIIIQTLIQIGKLKRGDKFLHPLLTFPTSCSSAIMAGLVPVYVDVDPATYVISTEGMKKAFRDHKDIKVAIIPALLGNIPDMDVLLEGLGDRPLVLDSCDVMCAKWNDKDVASFGTMFATSFYGSHIITSGGVGGGFGTNDEALYRVGKSMVFWGRDFTTDNLDKVQAFLKRYSYATIGIDAQMSALQAAFGLAQMDRLDDYVVDRHTMFRELQQLFVKYEKWFIQPERVSDKSDPVWFGYCLQVRDTAPFSREEFVEYLLNYNIEIRPIFCNLLSQAPYKKVHYHMVGSRDNAERIERTGVFLPLFSMAEDEKSYYFGILQSFLDKYK